MACRETLAAGLSARIAGCTWSSGNADPAFADFVDAGGNIRISSGHPHVVERLDPAPLPDLHREALALAWHDGAWDVQVLRHPALSGSQLGAVTAFVTFADPALCDALVAAAERGCLVTWTWLPIRNGPYLRASAHAAKDATLAPDGGRKSPCPAFAGIDWSRNGGIERIIRLGTWSEAHRPAPATPRRGPTARATGAQRSYIVALRKKTGRSGEPLPAALTRAQATAIIGELLVDVG